MHLLLKDRLIDQMILSIVPVLLGKGTRLFREDIPAEELLLVSTRKFESGLVQLEYNLKK